MNRQYTYSLLLLLVSFFGYSQCPPGPLGTGQFLDKPFGCATITALNPTGLEIEFTPIYSQLEDGSQIIIDWGDGTPNEVITLPNPGTQAGLSYNSPVPHAYTEANTNGACEYIITSFVDGPTATDCYTIAETTVTANITVWNTDNFPGIGFTQGVYNICAGSSATLQFEDNSQWNCTAPAIGSQNDQPRWTQWVYGTPSMITGTVLVDGNPVGFPFAGPVYDHVPAPILGPIAPGQNSFDIFIPTTATIGEQFVVTLNNWNQCNPYDDGVGGPPPPGGDNPPVTGTAIINIVPPPVPAFDVQNDVGIINPPEFCIDTDITFINNTVNATQYLWQFYDNPAGTGTPSTSMAVNPTIQYATGGDKLIRLTATNPTVDGTCSFFIEQTITLSPDALASFDFVDGVGTPINPDFCIDTGGGDVGANNTTVPVPGVTEFRWELYDGTGAFLSSLPAGAGVYDPNTATPIDLPASTYSAIGLTAVWLRARNRVTLCESIVRDTIFVYDQPIASFTSNEVCEGDDNTFSNITDQITGIPIRVNDDIIDTYEWDFDYDGVTFTTDLTRNDDLDFTQNLGPANAYTVALRVTTQKGGCVSSIFTAPVTVNPNPDSDLTFDVTGDLCPSDFITFTNASINLTLPNMEYFLEVTAPPAFNFSQKLTALDTLSSFPNTTTLTIPYTATLRAVSEDGCETISAPLNFNILPDEDSDFDDPSYDLFSSNCSPWNSTLVVNTPTDGDLYRWDILEGGASIPTFPQTTAVPTLNYQILNTSASIRQLEIVLEVEKSGICVGNDTIDIRISPQPTAAFTINKVANCDSVVFELQAIQEGLSAYNWSYIPAPFDEEGADDQRRITYLRNPNTGVDENVTISLTTTNLTGCLSESADSVELVEKRRPDFSASFALSDDTVQLPDATVDIFNTSSPDNGYTYLWNFGGQGSSTERDPGSFTFTNFGSFQVRLSITDEFCVEEAQQTVIVLPADPVIDFEADTLRGCSPLTVRFTNLSQSALPGEFFWEFGDGSTSNLDNPVHTYFGGGQYSVRLVGRNQVGDFQETLKDDYIEVLERPLANFIASSRIVFIPDQEVLFRNLSEGAVEYFWDFGDGFTSTDAEPQHAYTQEGFYDITLIAINELGCADTLLRDAEIEAVRGGETTSPNAFTPDLTGPSGGTDEGRLDVNSVNDIFLPRAEGVVRFRMYVYNKWGQLLFESNDQNVGWDGYYRGRLAPAGVYVYKLELRYSDGRDEIKAGDVTLIR